MRYLQGYSNYTAESNGIHNNENNNHNNIIYKVRPNYIYEIQHLVIEISEIIQPFFFFFTILFCIFTACT